MHEDERRTLLLSTVRRCRPDLFRPEGRMDAHSLRRRLRRNPETEGRAEELAESMADVTARLTIRTQPEELQPADVDVLEAIVHTDLRPALLIQDGTFLEPPPEWAHLEDRREVIDHAIARTCRVEVEGEHELDWIGTGFVVAPDLIATNRHVLDLVASFDGDRWRMDAGVSLHVDFREEIGMSAPEEVPVTGIWGVHNQFDIAILSTAPGSCPTPLTAGTSMLSAGNDVVVVGFPAYDSRRNDRTVMERIFRGIYNVKRLQPGQVMARDRANWTLRHDASTLGGNSGSPVISLATGRLVGIHFRGRYLQWNDAVDLSGA